jgi:hypothetical protein
MRNYPVVVSAASLMLAACNSELGMPADPVEQAATCAVVSASEARSTQKNLDTPLAFDRQSQIIHYALLAGARDPKFSRENAKNVVQRMQILQDRITGDQWKSLVEPCKTAFPEVDLGKPVTLPADPAEAERTCYALGDFMARALASYEATYSDQLSQYSKFLISRDEAAKKGGEKPVSSAESIAKRSAALAVAAKLGPPSKVMALCMAQFPADAKAAKDASAPKT